MKACLSLETHVICLTPPYLNLAPVPVTYLSASTATTASTADTLAKLQIFPVRVSGTLCDLLLGTKEGES